MTSGVFTYLPVSAISIDRENRQRRELDNIEELATSIRENGLINPIVVTRDGLLIAGERRLTAHKQLGFESIAVQYTDELDPLQLHLIELEENVRRDELTWQDRVQAVARYHEIQMEKAQKEDRVWSQDATAASLNMSQANVAKHLSVHKALEAGTEEVKAAPKFSTAANFVQRATERQKTAVLREIRTQPAAPPAESGDADTPAVAAPTRYAEVTNTDFLRWSAQVLDVPYNFIHCDFPYGINAGDKVGLSSAKSYGGYEDKPETYLTLLDTMLARQDNFIAPSAHLMFWYSMPFHNETIKKLTEAGWRVNPFPLIWLHSDNAGILSDAKRQPRRIYDTALIATRGDRPLVNAVSNAIVSPTTKVYHMSEKPERVLSHFFRMFVDENTVMLDPTCGSGNSVKTAEDMGANWSTGLELDPKYAELAGQNLDLEVDRY